MLRNTAAGTGNYGILGIGNDSDANAFNIITFSSTYSGTGANTASFSRIENNQASAGLNLVAGGASGTVNVYAGGEGAGSKVATFSSTAATFAGAVTVVGGAVIGGTTTLPAAGNVNWHLYTSGAEKKMLIGDGSGYSLALTKRTGSVSTDVITFTDGGAATFTGIIKPQQATTAGAPAYVKGAIYFDTTLNKLRVGGATGWETITSV